MKTNENGRYWIHDPKTGRTFCIEPISERDQKVTDQVFKNGGYDTTSTKWHSEAQGGSIREEESIITKDKFKNIMVLPPGTSPDSIVEQILKGEIGKSF